MLRVGLGIGLLLAACWGAVGAQLTAPGIDLTCYPNRLRAEEGKWTFLLRGKGTLQVESAALEVGTASYPAARIAYPTPNAAVIDVTFPPLPPAGGAKAALVLYGAPKKEVARFSIPIESWPEPPVDRRMTGIVRLQLKPWAILYPLHGTEVKERTLAELTGDKQFLGLLQDLGVLAVRKAISRYAEDDSLHWNPATQRQDELGGDVLRTYLLVIDPMHSEAAVKQIMIASPQVQKAFVNEDRSR